MAPILGKATAVSLLAGACLCLWLPTLPSWPLLLVALLAGMWGLSRNDWRRPLGALLLGVGWAGLHAVHGLSAQLPAQWEKREVEVRGRVVELPQAEVRRTRFLFRVDGDESQPEPLRGKLLQLSWYDDFNAHAPGPRMRLHAGERWRFTLRVRTPRGLRNPGGFDSERYALARRIAASGYVRNPESAAPLAMPRGLDAWRERTSARIAKQVPSASSRFVRALALGDTGGLDDGDWEILRATGLTHLVAISGFHVGLVSGFFALLASLWWRALPALARHVPRPQAAAVSALLGALGYAAVAGFALPTVRTLLMIAIVALAYVLRRGLRAGDALALAAIVVVLFDPLSPLAVGFWLSFAGVAWLLWCLPHDSGRSLLREFLSAQGVATIGLLPLTVVLFGQASLVGPLANLVAIPWWSLVVVPLALLGTALETLHAGLGEWAWGAAAWCFDGSWKLFAVLAQSRFALWWLPEGRWFALPLAMLGAFWLLLPRGVPGKPLALLLWLPLLWPDRDLPRHGEAQLTVIDVGQGLSVLVRTQRHVLLYDAGPAVRDGFDAGERAVVPALHALGVARLDRAVISHGDNDHAGGFEAVRRAVPIGDAFVPAGSPTPAGNHCVAGQDWEWDGVRFRFLHPTPNFPYLANESSCVLRIETARGAALLPGDIGEVVERRLLRGVVGDPGSDPRQALRADVVLAAHHGSAGSSDPGFVAATGARLVLVSTGHGNRFGHPVPGVVARWRHAGAEVLDTADSGALTVWLSADGLAVRERRAAFPRLWDAARRP